MRQPQFEWNVVKLIFALLSVFISEEGRLGLRWNLRREASKSSILLSIAVLKGWPEIAQGGNGSLCPTTLRSQPIPEEVRTGTQGRNQETATAIELRKKYCLLAYSCLGQAASLEQFGWPAQKWPTYNELSSAKCTRVVPQSNPLGAVFPIEGPLHR